MIRHWRLFKKCIEDDPYTLQKLLKKVYPDYMKTTWMLDVAIEHDSREVVAWLAGRKETTEEDLKYGIERAKFYKRTELVNSLSCKLAELGDSKK